MSKVIKIIISTISILLVLLILAVSVYFFWPWHKDFFNNADEEFKIPGLDTDFCPQGMCRLDAYNKYIISGYMNDGSPSRFYVIDAETNAIEYYFILNIDGSLYNGHAGGIACYGNTLWTTSQHENGEGYAFRFRASDVMNIDNGEEIELGEYDYFKTLNNADFVFVQDKLLWIGEFYREGNYETDANHHLVTSSGETNRAIAYAYEIDESQKFGIKYSSTLSGDGVLPVKALSIRDLCQGIDVTSEGNFVMSTSYSIADSNIYYYKNVLEEEPHGQLRVGIHSIDLWYLDNNALINSKSIPAMSEEIFIKNNRVYILFENSAKKYKYYNRVRIDSVYSIPLSYLDKN